MGDKVQVEFISDQFVTAQGFQLSYSCDEKPPTPAPVQCGGELTENSGTVTTPGWPDLYPNNANCLWEKKCPKGEIVEIKFSSFSVEFEKNCM